MRWRNFLFMLPFFIIGIAIPIYYFGLSGDDGASTAPSVAAAPSADYSPGALTHGRAVVGASRDLFDRTADQWITPHGLSRASIKLLLLGGLFALGYVVLRVILAVLSGAFSGVAKAAFGFLVHKAVGPMFMGFLAVGSTWGIHQTIAEQFGLPWAAVTVAVTAAVATLFALAGVELRSE
jgi:hypothetical protein